jgi:toxin-antitoxin system PIN domain toxin
LGRRASQPAAALTGRIRTKSYLPDLNVWLALSWARHKHSDRAWEWFAGQESDAFLFCRISQLGLLRLLTTSAVMGSDVCTIQGAWSIYDRWLEDARVSFTNEPQTTESALRAATRPFARTASPKALGDCYLRAISQATKSVLVTFDVALASACAKDRQHVALLL